MLSVAPRSRNTEKEYQPFDCLGLDPGANDILDRFITRALKSCLGTALSTGYTLSGTQTVAPNPRRDAALIEQTQLFHVCLPVQVWL